MAKRFNRMNRRAVLHFFELNVREFRRPFVHDDYARAALTILRRECDEHPAKLIAYVVMPDHLHAIVNPRDGDILRFIGGYKAAVTLEVAELAARRGHDTAVRWLCNTTDGHRQLWQDGKHDFYLYSDRLIWQKIDYIHNNPIKAGLVRHAGEYPYSSFAAVHATGGQVIVPVDHDFWWEEAEDFVL